MGKRVAIVTGGSSGIGRCTATALAQSGCVVYELSRRDIPLKGAKHLNTDVTDWQFTMIFQSEIQLFLSSLFSTSSM